MLRRYGGARHSITSIYCRTADRLLGGNRRRQFILELERRLAVRQERVKEAQKDLDQRIAELFETDLHLAELTNQHFPARQTKPFIEADPRTGNTNTASSKRG